MWVGISSATRDTKTHAPTSTAPLPPQHTRPEKATSPAAQNANTTTPRETQAKPHTEAISSATSKAIATVVSTRLLTASEKLQLASEHPVVKHAKANPNDVATQKSLQDWLKLTQSASSRLAIIQLAQNKQTVITDQTLQAGQKLSVAVRTDGQLQLLHPNS